MNTTYDTTGWTIYEPAEFDCIDAYTGHSRTAGVIKPVFILELYNEQKNISVIKFFNCKKTKKGNLVVDKNSDFACIYRASVGEDPRPRYSKAKQLLHHLIGLNFICEYEEARDRKDSLYFRATKIEPVAPQPSDEWFLNGKLKNKRGTKGRRPPSSIQLVNQQKSYQQRPDNNEAITREKAGYKLEIINPDNTNDSKVSGAIFTACQHPKSIDSNVESLRHGCYVDIEIVSDRERVFRYSRSQDTTYDDYLDLVIDDALSR